MEVKSFNSRGSGIKDWNGQLEIAPKAKNPIEMHQRDFYILF